MFDLDSPYNNENRRVPDYKLMKAGQKEGWEINTYDLCGEVSRDDVFVAFNHYQNIFAKYGKKVRFEHRILIAFEPFLDDNFNKRNKFLYNKILTCDLSLVDNKKYFHFFYPITKMDIKQLPIEKRKFLVNISHNKRASHPQELYSERVKAIETARFLFHDKFDLYGTRWDKSKFSLQSTESKACNLLNSYRGYAENKYEVLRNYKFSLCYENVKNRPGYISEKIFDCFQCGVSPLYYGAPDVTRHIPEETMIWRERFNSIEEMLYYAKKMSKEDMDEKKNTIAWFLSSDLLNKFRDDTYVEKIINTIKLCIKKL